MPLDEKRLYAAFHAAQYEAVGRPLRNNGLGLPSACLIFVSHNHEVLRWVPELPGVKTRAVLLGELPLAGGLQDNRLGEGRGLLFDWAGYPDTDFVGFLNARLLEKYHYLPMTWDRLLDSLKGVKANQVLAPWPAQVDWAEFSELMHVGITPLLKELEEFTGMRLRTGRRGLWANDFVCHWSVWLDFLRYWRKTFDHFHGRYGFDLPFPSYNIDPNRKPAYFYERLACLYFSNRHDLDVVAI
jgi:hypothetical protein